MSYTIVTDSVALTTAEDYLRKALTEAYQARDNDPGNRAIFATVLTTFCENMVYNDTPIQSPVKQHHGSRENLAVASAPAILQLSRPLQSQERLQQRAWIEDWVQNLVEEYTEQLRQARLHEQAREQERLRQQHEAERWQASARQRELAYHERELALRRSQARLRETAQVQAHEGEEALARRRAEQQERALVERSLLWAGQQASQREFATSEQDPMDDE